MIERRTFETIEVRADGDEGHRRLIGHAAVFNKKSEEIFGFREIVLPGAFKNSIQKNDIRALWNHDPAHVLGRNKAGTLRLREDDTGLRTEIDLPDTQIGLDVWKSVKRGDVDQMSFGFRTISDKWFKDGGVTIRELAEVELFDVSPVTYPAYPQTDISARSFYELRMAEIASPETTTEQDKQKAKELFEAQSKLRRAFIAERTPKPGRLSYSEILKHCKQ